MTVDEVLDAVERKIPEPPNRGVLQEDIREELSDLYTGEDWSFSVVTLDPIAKTSTGKRSYPLPEDFPLDFLSGAGSDGSRQMVKISDGSNEHHLHHKTIAELFEADFESASNARPDSYTITYDEEGRANMYLDPPPDANGTTAYTLRGAYRRGRVSRLTGQDRIPEAVSQWAIYAVAARYNPQWEGRERSIKARLYKEEAMSRKAAITPQMSDTLNSEDYSQMRGYW